jgi:hypothetical protein
MSEAITIRHSTYADDSAIRRLAALDDRLPPDGDALLAFVDTELRAAVSLGGDSVVADPFHLTDELVALLRFRALQAKS